MQFLAYIVVVLVSFSTILLELHWLTSPTKQPTAVVQVAAVPVARAKIDGPNVELSPVYPRPEAPRSVGAVTGSPPADANAPAPEAKTEPKAEAKVEPAQIAKPPQAATVASKFEANSETTGAATPADSSATFKSTVVPTPAPPEKTANSAQPVAVQNSCDVQACARAYSSFSAADCTFQPFQGPRQVCVKPPAQAQQKSAAVTREPSADFEREQSKKAELQRAVQFLRDRRAAEEADYDAPVDERGRDVMVRRPGWR